MLTMLPALEGNLHFLEQACALLEILTDEAYARRRPGWSPVGAQVRHVLDHYEAFLAGLPGGRVNYDLRARDAEVERDRATGLRAAERILGVLRQLDADAALELLVHADAGGPPGELDWRPSTVGRELQFLASHTVHHFALIKLLLEGQGIILRDDFGTAPSTLAYHASSR